MKNIKRYTLFSFFLLLFSIVFQLKNMTEFYFLLFIIFLEGGFTLYTIFTLYRKDIICYSCVYTQFLLLVFSFILIDFNGYHLILFVLITILLVYLLNQYHDKKLIIKGKKTYYRLINANNFILTIIYIGYGIIYYGLFILNNPKYKLILSQAENLLYFAFVPYVIIILLLFRLQYDRKTDMFNTNKKYTVFHLKSLIIRNLLLNGLSIIIILL